MKVWARWALAAGLVLLAACSSHASATVVRLDPGHDSQNLTPSALLWHDAKGDLTLADLQQLINTFAPLSANTPRLGRLEGALWVAVHIDNPQSPVLRHLRVGPARTELLEAWLIAGPPGSPAQPLGRSGLSVPLGERPLPGATAAWVLNLPQGPSTVLLRLQSRTSLRPQISLWMPSALAQEERIVDLHEGQQAGALALITFLALVFALWLRESTWAWYAGASASLLVYQSCFSGQAVLWLWPSHLSWTLPALAAALAGTHVCVVLFFLRFIPAPHVPVWGQRAALGLSGLSLLGLLVVLLFGFEMGIGLLEFAGFLLPFMLPWLAWRAWRHGDSPARFVLLSFSFLAVASVLRGAVIHGWLASAPWLENWLVPLAAVLTSGVLMLAMADRLRLQRSQQLREAQRYQVTLQDAIRGATQELIQSRDVAEAAVQFKQRFLSRVSHELRTPLHTLLGNAALARRELDQLPRTGSTAEQDRLMESVQAMQRSGKDILQLADELLELARGEAGHLSLVTAPVNLLQHVLEIASNTRWLALHQGNKLEVKTELSVSQVVMDAARFEQVLRNLLANACVATHQGLITLAVSSSLAADGVNAQMEVSVSDTGRGIAPEALERIFEPFEQLDARSATGSSGLGLAIARQWVRLMGGELVVQSTPGQGSVFSWSMQVPVSDAALVMTATPAEIAPPIDSTLDWAQLRALADSGDGLGVDAWIARHRNQMGDDARACGVLALGDSMQLAALVRWLDQY
ncbi:MAG: sensor histidine kinase [Rhodoferax sp.]|uniref:sensor histidine kinase n=1 Tax=Rhodoferax sp. TaxID=50421 RepID=UPI003018C24C